MKLLSVVFTAVIAFFPPLYAQEGRADFEVPQLNSPVVDQANIMSSEGLTRVERLVRSLYESGGSQISVLTVKSLGGLTIEEASIKVVDKWKLGRQDKDDGILLLIAPSERRVRIEVGRGKEGDLPDAWARRIISQVITPAFKQGHIDDGILLGVAAIIQKTDPQFDLESAGAPRARMRSSGSSGGISLFHLIFIIFILIWMFMRPFRRLGMYGSRGYSHWGGGGFGGSSGGGWSGGGGGFSGGGSSGSW